ncbi:MAG: hypothetical protein DRH37_09020 [Deltaproteobacteria bacterium]|nr:MAG: hypothetical protein DRH37_09020 [Deltaproteobacteria bacterium]
MKSLLCSGLAAIALFSFVLVRQQYHQRQTGLSKIETADLSQPPARSNTSVSIPSERVAGRIKALNGFSWHYGYDIGLKDDKVVIQVRINLLPGEGVSKPDIERVEPSWERGIERIWSDKFSLETSSGKKYPVVIDVTFRGPEFHHDVIVRPGSGGTDELNWNLLDTSERVAHEFGHMIGLFDEYDKGALAPQNPLIDSGSIMTSDPGQGVIARERHFEPFRRWFVRKTMMSNVRIIHEQATYE